MWLERIWGGRDDSQAVLLSSKERLVPDVLLGGWKSAEGVGHVQEVAPESNDGGIVRRERRQPSALVDLQGKVGPRRPARQVEEC